MGSETCILQVLPFWDLLNYQVKALNPKFILPSCDELNDKFIYEKNDENVSGDDFKFTYFSYQTNYSYSNNISSLFFSFFKQDFSEEAEHFESFPIISLNIRSIVNRENFTKFQAFLQNLSVKPSIIAINETWINDSSKGPFSKLKGYKFVQNNMHDHVGGGVAFYVAEHLHFSKIDSLSTMHEKVFESIFVNIEIDGKNVIFGNIYRTPDARHDAFTHQLHLALNESTRLNNQVVIMGDMNYDLLYTSNSYVNNFVNNFFEFGMYPLINIPTRITETTATVLDHFWTNIIDKPTRSAIVANPISDHLPIYLNIGMKNLQKKL